MVRGASLSGRPSRDAVIERVAIYCRQSDSAGAGERSLSLESQEAELRARCAREGWHVVRAVRDADLKGYQDADQRPGMAEVLALAAAREITLLLVWDMSRLARMLEYQERWIRILAAAGVEVESHTEPDVRRNALIRQIKGAIAEDRTREISAHVRRAKRARAEKGHHNGPVPYGYASAGTDAPLALGDPEAVAAVRLIFRMAADGAGTTAIVAALEAAGHRSPWGMPRWNHRGVGRTIANEAYRGTLVWGSVRVEGAHPPIVDDDAWQAAQRPHRAPRTKAASSWLEGQVVHACGSPMYFVPPDGHKRPRGTYRCQRTWPSYRDQHGPCPLAARDCQAVHLEQLAWHELRAGLLALPAIDRIVADARRRWRGRTPEEKRARQLAEQRLAAARARLARAEDLHLSGSRDRAWFDVEDARAKSAIAAAEAELSLMPAPPEPLDIEAAMAPLRSAAAALSAAEDAPPEIKARILRAVGTVVVAPGEGRCGRGRCPEVTIVPYPHLAPIWPHLRT